MKARRASHTLNIVSEHTPGDVANGVDRNLSSGKVIDVLSGLFNLRTPGLIGA